MNDERDRWPALMTPATAAEYLDVSPDKIRVLRRQKKLKARQPFSPGKFRYARTDLDAFIDATDRA